MAVKDRNYTREVIEAEVVEVPPAVCLAEVPAGDGLTPAQEFVKTVMLKGIYGFIGLVKEAEKKYAV